MGSKVGKLEPVRKGSSMVLFTLVIFYIYLIVPIHDYSLFKVSHLGFASFSSDPLTLSFSLDGNYGTVEAQA